ncbi:MAG: hypothetical protein MUP55_01470 [Candidatus Aenigmarchaeota archaeon]|nr:hypothetical protein [Candidatus Aenigmarchaeota archaeon]
MVKLIVDVTQKKTTLASNTESFYAGGQDNTGKTFGNGKPINNGQDLFNELQFENQYYRNAYGSNMKTSELKFLNQNTIIWVLEIYMEQQGNRMLYRGQYLITVNSYNGLLTNIAIESIVSAGLTPRRGATA